MARRRLGFWMRLAVSVFKPLLLVMTRRRWRGLDHVPATGGVILAVNHISHVDPFTIAHFVNDAGRELRYLGKSSLFHVPVLGAILRSMRHIPVYRGTADAAQALDAAVTEVDAGAAVIIYPEGTTTRQPDLWPMRGRTGVARLALATGAPVIPIAQWGAQRFYNPVTKRFAVWPRTPVAVTAGPPVDLSRWQGRTDGAALYEITDAIMLQIRDQLAEIRGETPPDLHTSARTGTTGQPATGTAAGGAEAAADQVGE